MRICYTNEIDALETTSLTALTEVAGFGKENVQDQRLTTKWQTSAVTTQSMIITFASTVSTSILSAAVIGHNIATTTTVTIQANSANSWGSPAMTTAMTVIDSTLIIQKFFATAQQYKYWRFLFTGQGSLAIGRLWLSSYIDVDPQSTNNFTVTKKRNDNVQYGRGRQKFANPGTGWRQFNLTFPPTRTTMLTAIQTLYDTVGNHTSFIFCNFDDIRTYAIVEPCYCSIVGDIGFNHTNRMQFEYGLTLEEDL